MDQLAPLLSQISLSAESFFSGELCQLVTFDKGAGHIHILRSGQVSMTVRNGRPQLIDKPSVLFFPRSCLHELVPIENGTSELLCAYVDLGAKVGSPLALSLPEVIILPIDDMNPLGSTLDLLFKEAFGDILIQVLRHVIEIGELQNGIFAALADSRLKHAVTAMHERPGHPWTLDELADVSGMSRARFAVNFREAVGITPLDYLTDWRMSVAQNLLKLGRPIKSVAAAVGYQSQAALARVFTKRVGYAPSEWLKQLESS